MTWHGSVLQCPRLAGPEPLMRGLRRAAGRFTRRPHLPLQMQIALLAAALVLVSVSAGTVVVALYALRTVEAQAGQRAMHVARTVAEINEVKRFLGQPGGEKVIQPIAERVRIANGMEYVVVIDQARRRYSHPLVSRIGTRFESEDGGPAFAEHSYISYGRGERGNSVRAFVPVMSEDLQEQVGVVLVGVITPSVAAVLHDLRPQLALTLLVATAVGLAGAWLLGGRIKRQLLGLEPAEIARQLQERVAILDAIGEGVIAIDRQQRVTVLNAEAQRVIGVGESALGRPIAEIIPNSRLPQILETAARELNQEMVLGTTTVLTNRVPVWRDGKIIGAVATFRDRTEFHRLAEELTGVRAFVDSLRAQNHEHMNRLHTIAGLIKLGRYQQASDYIFASCEEQQEQTRFLATHFADPRIAGLLLGKLHRARELGVQLELDPACHLESLADHEAGALVVVLGNLVENAMEAVAAMPPDRRRVQVRVDDEDGVVTVVVRDTGPGIPPALQEQVWQPGFSTKAASGRGVGLALVRRRLESLGGAVALESGPWGSCFTAWLPRTRPDAASTE
ncbi:MAG: sensor histidine kinase [Symbiobacterium sp.]|uniref:ATP-binding protein n=1 Tax=Symbiobacterium sp. TaxID=1971213 RepID=UPI0034646E18